MNKLFSKVAALSVGLAMAIGVGVAVGSKKAAVAKADTTVTFTVGTDSGSTELSKDGVSVTTTSGTFSRTDNYRVYANNSMTVSYSSGNITAMSFTLSQNTFTADVGTWSNGSWSGSASSVTLSASGGQVRFTEFSVTVSGGSSVTYTITYDANGGSGTMADSTNTVSACTFIAPTGKRFASWNTAANGSGASYAPGDPVSDDTDLFAIWEDKPLAVTLDKIGSTLGSEYSSSILTVDILDGSDTYTLNYVNGKKQSDAMILQKSSGAFISNKTVMPGVITSVEVFINSGASGSATYDVAFGASEFTVATAGIGAQNITGGNSHTFTNSSVTDAKYFCITLGAAYNGQVLKIVVNYSTPKKAAAIENNYHSEGPFEVYAGGASMTFMFYDATGEYHERVYDDLEWEVSDATVLDLTLNTTECYVAGLKVGSATLLGSAPGYEKVTVTISVVEDPTLPEMEIWDNTWKLDDEDGYWWSDTADLYWFYAHPEGDTEKTAEERTILGGVTWESSDTTVATITTQPGGQGSVTCLKPGQTKLTATKSGYKSVSVIVKFNAGPVSELHISGSMTKTSYTTDDSAWDPSGFVVKAYHGNTGWEDVITSEATWTYNPAAPAEGVTSVVATAHWNDGEDDYQVSSSAQAVTVTVVHAGTAADPFTVAEGIAKCVEIGNKSGGQGPWVTTGQISSIVQVLTTGFQNARFYITEDGKTTSPSIYAYDCKYLGNAGFTEETAAEIVVGATVTITGNLLNYNNNTPEYARGCYLLDIQAPETGDVDVAFEPASTSFDIGATGTFTASSETSGVTFTWAVDDSSVLSVNASTGAYEAMGLGVARVTVTASAGGKEGFAFVDFVVNGGAGNYYSVADANTICSGVESGKTTAYEIYVEGYVKEFATSSKDGNPRAFDIMTLDEESSIMVYTNTDPYASFVEGLSLGDRIVVKGKLQNYNDKYEIVEPEKVGSNASAITFALNFISQTDAICEGYDGKSDNSEALEAIWSSLSSSYSALYDNQKSILMGAERDESGTAVERAVARYDYLVGKYGLDNFITGRTPVQFAYVGFGLNDVASDNNTMIIVVVIAAVSALAFTTLLVFKKKKQK